MANPNGNPGNLTKGGSALAYTKDQVLAAIEKGITATGTAKVLGVTKECIRNYRKRWQCVDEAILAKRFEVVDLAETSLRVAVLNREPWAVSLALKTLGRNRGYTERTEITGAGGGPVQVVAWAPQSSLDTQPAPDALPEADPAGY